MSFDSDRQSIEQYFIDNMSVSLRFEGHDYKNQSPPFVGVIVSPEQRANDTLGNTQQTDGTIIIRVFTNRTDGIKELLDLCDQVSVISDNQQIGNVTTRAMDAPQNLNTDDSYLAKEMSVPYFSS